MCWSKNSINSRKKFCVFCFPGQDDSSPKTDYNRAATIFRLYKKRIVLSPWTVSFSWIFFFCFTQKRCQLFFFFYSTQEKTISLNEEKSVLWSPRVEFVYNPNILRLIDCITTRSKSESNFWKKVKIHLFFFFFSRNLPSCWIRTFHFVSFEKKKKTFKRYIRSWFIHTSRQQQREREFYIYAFLLIKSDGRRLAQGSLLLGPAYRVAQHGG